MTTHQASPASGTSPARPVPGPSRWDPRTWHALLLRIEQFEWAFERYGDIAGVWTPNFGPLVMLRDADMITGALAAEPGLASFNARPNAILWGPRSLFGQEGAEHQRLRTLLLPGLGHKAVGRYRADIAALAEQMVDSFPPAGTPFPLLAHVQRPVLYATLRHLFGLDDRAMRAWLPPIRALLRAGMSQRTAVRFALRRAGAMRVWPAFHQARAACGALVQQEIDRRRQCGDLGDDILGVLMKARTPQGARLTDPALIDQSITLMAAGHVTNSLAIAWSVERVIRHPQVLERLADEATAADSDAYATAVASEAMRQRPPAVAAPLGVTRQPLTLGGYRVETGTGILVAIRSLHHNPRYFPDPHLFQPERFLDDRPARNTWMPFGVGPRLCIGRHLAMLQATTFLQVMARRVVLRPVETREEPLHRIVINNHPAHGCMVTTEPRTTARRPPHQPPPRPGRRGPAADTCPAASSDGPAAAPPESAPEGSCGLEP
ncbi:cytochrome P450 [Actinomadura sp. 3N508]|uniref:cytochrome P450 n=1 Tax=Actinomadura sp. 3N508 TaxID=3375153 RepID=UPI0037BD6339